MLRAGIITLDQCDTVKCVFLGMMLHCLDGSDRTKDCAVPLFNLHVFTALSSVWCAQFLFESEQAVISCLVFFDELFTIHPAYLWARETLILGLKL